MKTIFAYLLYRADRFLLYLRFPAGEGEWWPDWAYGVHFIPSHWTWVVEAWADKHGWRDDWYGTYRRLSVQERRDGCVPWPQ